MAIAAISDGEAGSSVRTKLNALIALANLGWTEVILGSDVTNSSVNNVDVTGLAFTPAANKIYAVEVDLIVSSVITTTGVRPGVTPPGGTAMTAAYTQAISSGVLALFTFGTTNDSTNIKSGAIGHPANSIKALDRILARVISGATPSGTFQITVATEIDTSAVTVHAGSSLRYREVA